MIIKASATFDTKDQLDDFVEQLSILGAAPIIKNQTVSVNYIGYNRTLYTLIIDAFEDLKRSSIVTSD